MASADGSSQRLNRDEVALVLKRAAELEATAAQFDSVNGAEGIDAAAVEEAASEVGLSTDAVRQAMAELRVGALPATPVRQNIQLGRPSSPPRRRRLVVPRLVGETRMVSSAPELVQAAADEFFGFQTFEVRRRHAYWTMYRPGRTVPAVFKRAVNYDGAVHLRGVRAVAVTVQPVGPGPYDEAGTPTRSLVRVEATLKPGRTAAVSAAMGAGAATILTSGAIALGIGEPVVALAGTAVGTGIGATGWSFRRRWRRRRGEEVVEVLAALLDALT